MGKPGTSGSRQVVLVIPVHHREEQGAELSQACKPVGILAEGIHAGLFRETGLRTRVQCETAGERLPRTPAECAAQAVSEAAPGVHDEQGQEPFPQRNSGKAGAVRLYRTGIYVGFAEIHKGLSFEAFRHSIPDAVYYNEYFLTMTDAESTRELIVKYLNHSCTEEELKEFLEMMKDSTASVPKDAA